MPRRHIRRTDFETRVRNMLEAAEGLPAMAGRSRIGTGLLAGGGALPKSEYELGDEGASAGAAKLLVLTTASDSIASGGDTVSFGTPVAQHGFDSVAPPLGGAWTHPVAGVYALDLEFAWSGYAGGGDVHLMLNGSRAPEGQIASGTSGERGRGTIMYLAEAGAVGQIHVTQSSGAAQTCSATVRIAITDPATEITDGNAVSLGTQASPDVAAWAGLPPGWTDPNAHWIWHSGLAGGERPDGEQAWFQGTFDLAAAGSVNIEAAADNFAEVFFNGTLLGSFGDSTGATNTGFDTRHTFTANAVGGTNRITARAQNGTSANVNPAGFILSLKNAGGTVLLRTTDEGGWWTWTSEPTGWPTP